MQTVNILLFFRQTLCRRQKVLQFVGNCQSLPSSRDSVYFATFNSSFAHFIAVVYRNFSADSKIINLFRDLQYATLNR